MTPTNARTLRRTRAADLRRAARAEAARRQEERDEAVAPAAQRNAVLDGSGAVLRDPNGAVIAEMQDGTMLREALRGPNGAVMRETGAGVLRAARVQRDGVAFIRSNPIDHLIARGAAKLERGEMPMFTLAHKLAVDRLVILWDLVGEGVGLGASDWGSLRGSRGTAPTTPAGHQTLLEQVGRQIEVEATAMWLGGLWPIVRDVGLKGMSLAAWATREGMNPTAAAGYLKAALDRLIAMGAQPEPERRAKIRTIGPARAAYDARVSVGAVE
jgi:hypothetical protein